MITLYCFWWFQFRHISEFSEYWVTFKGSDSLVDAKVLPSDRPLVMHFIDPKCPCSRFTIPHLAKLKSEFSHIAEFVHYESREFSARVKTEHFDVPAGPSVAIWSKLGELSYFGPYSGGAVCGQGEDFVARILTSLEAGGTPHWINQEAVGCFCKWT